MSELSIAATRRYNTLLKSGARALTYCALLLLGVLTSPVARADDTADEADLQFKFGAEAYQRADFRTALSHFLASNRLVANKNVLFNIARCYEKLASYPEAFRYYTQALEGEKDEASRAKIRTALDELRANVAIVQVVTSPPGATLYVDRKDLGARGESPRTLGLNGGRYVIFAELAGYEGASAEVPEAKVGTEVRVEIKLKPILGTVRVRGAPPGAEVAVDLGTSRPSCSMPCDLALPPGRQMLNVVRVGFRAVEVPVDVIANRSTSIDVNLEPLMGSLLVSTDEAGALIEVDGRPRGFTPAILPLAVGNHSVRITLPGFRAVERQVKIAEGAEARLDEVLAQSEEVVAASRVSERVQDAPSSVSLVPRQELRRLAYPTIAEATRGVRGFYIWDDRSYVAVGVRGLGRLSSYGNRTLVLYDGHPANDNWIGSSYVGYDALTNLENVDRIEFVRGPGSVLYGTNAFSGVINVVTRYRDVPEGVVAGVGTALDGVALARVRGDLKFGKDSGLWTSVSTARSGGRDFYFPELARASTGPADAGFDGNVRGRDGFRAGNVQGRYYYKDWTVQWLAHTYEKHLPTGEYETTLGDARTRQADSRLFLEAKGEPEIATGLRLLTRLHANHYRFEGYYAREAANGGVERDTFRGSWVGAEERLTWTPSKLFRLMAGGEGQLHLQVDQKAKDDGGYFLDGCGQDPAAAKSCRYQLGAGYFVADATASESVHVSLGARLDVYSTFGASLNPRAALIVKPYEAGNTKVMAGKAFRAPSIYELYYNDGGLTQVIPQKDLRPESTYSFEVEHSHEFSPTVIGFISGYVNDGSSLIVTRGNGDAADPLYYENSETALVVLGGELGIRRDWRQGWMLGASYGYANPRYVESSNLSDLFRLKEDTSKRDVANAPEHSGSVKGAVPVIGRGLTLGSKLTLESGRYDRNEEVGAEPQGRSGASALWDIVLSGDEKRYGVHYAFGVYNAFDWRYRLPLTAEFSQRTLSQSGRTFLAQVELAY
ncbi:MAG: TonB-dependent receptor [Polyangiaceae bacterium]|nr:TonB-dependent receptor [Polyangiaceae bacterium]